MRPLVLLSRFLLVVFAVTLLSSCSVFTEYGRLEDSARKAYLAGNYDSAVLGVVRSLKIEPTYEASQELIQMVFPMANEKHLGVIAGLNDSGEKFKWDTAVSEYDSLIKINEAVKSLPPLTAKKSKEVIKFNIVDYSQKLAEAKNNAAEAHYQEGVLLSKNGTSARERAAREFTTANRYVPGFKNALALAAEGYYQEGLRLARQDGVNIQKQAAKEFKTAMTFVADYKDSATQYEKARKAGIKRVAIIPFEDKSGKAGRYGAVAETVVDQITSQIMNDQSAMEFLEIISRDQLENVMREQKLGRTGVVDEATAISLGKVLGVHEIITGKITGISNTPERTTTRNVGQKNSVVVGEQAYTDHKGRQQTRNVYGDVTATVTMYKRTAATSVNGSYNIVDVKTAKVIKTNAFIGKADFVAEWGTYSGDERALDSAALNLCRKSEEAPPSEDELANKALRDLSGTLADAIISYAK